MNQASGNEESRIPAEETIEQLLGPSRLIPSGTITFLFTDIEGSTKLWELYPKAMGASLAKHDQIVRSAIEQNGGYIFKTLGDAFCAAFSTPAEALRAASSSQRNLAKQPWGETGPLRVRMGIHTGVAEQRDDDYFGGTLNRTARILSIGHGGQILLSNATSQLALHAMPEELSLKDLGMHRLKDLDAAERIWQVLHPELPGSFTPLNSLDNLPTNLPISVTSFIGREKQLEEIGNLLNENQLLTLAGSGGTGKTRLALQASAEALERFKDGVWLVELASLADENLVPQTIAEVLHIKESPGADVRKNLVEQLRSKELLLLLDNCEHLLDAVRDVVESILRGCPKVKLFLTSREPLTIHGEQTYRVPSLSTPKDNKPANAQSALEYEAVRLFVERAISVKADFGLTAGNVSAVSSICRHLDGIPLAIELAAARVRALSIDQLEKRLDERFRLLTGGSRTSLPRQQTLRATIDWSFNLLNEQEQALLVGLSVFQGGFSLESVEAVCSGDGIERWQVLDLLTSLVDKSLVGFEDGNDEARYGLLETVREYAKDKLSDAGNLDQIRAKHLDYYLLFTETAETKLKGVEQPLWFRRLDGEYENIRAALDFSLTLSSPNEALSLCGYLWQYWWTRAMITEGQDWCNRALSKVKVDGSGIENARALNTAGRLAWLGSEFATAQENLEASLSLYRSYNAESGMAEALAGLGGVALHQSDYPTARKHHEESLALRRKIDDRQGIASSLNNLGCVALFQGDLEDSRAYYEESAKLRREVGDRHGLSATLGNLACVVMDQGDLKTAHAYLTECFQIINEIADRNGAAYCLEAFAQLATKENDLARAVTLWSAVQKLRAESNSPRPQNEADQYAKDVASVRAQLGEEAFLTAWEVGQSMSELQATDFALG